MLIPVFMTSHLSLSPWLYSKFEHQESIKMSSIIINMIIAKCSTAIATQSYALLGKKIVVIIYSL